MHFSPLAGDSARPAPSSLLSAMPHVLVEHVDVAAQDFQNVAPRHRHAHAARFCDDVGDAKPLQVPRDDEASPDDFYVRIGGEHQARCASTQRSTKRKIIASATTQESSTIFAFLSGGDAVDRLGDLPRMARNKDQYDGEQEQFPVPLDIGREHHSAELHESVETRNA